MKHKAYCCYVCIRLCMQLLFWMLFSGAALANQTSGTLLETATL